MGGQGGSLCEGPVQFGKGQAAAVSIRIESLHLQPPGDSYGGLGRKLPWNWIQKLLALGAASLNRDGSQSQEPSKHKWGGRHACCLELGGGMLRKVTSANSLTSQLVDRTASTALLPAVCTTFPIQRLERCKCI